MICLDIMTILFNIFIANSSLVFSYSLFERAFSLTYIHLSAWTLHVELQLMNNLK